MSKLKIYGFVFLLIVVFGLYVADTIKETGKLEQANATLKKSVEDGEKERAKLKATAALNSATIDKVSKEKAVLNTYALKKAHELELLKYENAEIKKWSINVMPYVLSGKLFGLTNNDNANGLYISAYGVINANAGSEIEVRNEALYNYANDLESAVKSCNADKSGLIDWYVKAGIMLE